MVRIPLRIGRKPGDLIPLVLPVHTGVILVIQAYLVHRWALGGGFDPSGASRLAFAATAVAVVSVLLHEIGHAVAARESGMPVYGIVMTPFGGATVLPGWVGPGKSLRATLGGPLVTAALVLCGAMVYATTLYGHPRVPTVGTVSIEFFLLLNAIMLVANLLPGLPLDGGRLLQGAIWRASRDPVRAAQAALVASGVVAVALDLVAVWALLVNGDVVLAVIVGPVGAAVTTALPHASAYARGLARVVGYRVSDVLVPEPRTAPAGMSPATAWRELFKPSGLSAIPVIGEDGRPIGRVTAARMRELCGDDRRTLAEFAEPWPAVRGDLPVADLLRHPVVFDEGGLLPVVDSDGRFAGMTCLLRVQQVALAGRA